VVEVEVEVVVVVVSEVGEVHVVDPVISQPAAAAQQQPAAKQQAAPGAENDLPGTGLHWVAFGWWGRPIAGRP
jgi:hypothetical protein